MLCFLCDLRAFDISTLRRHLQTHFLEWKYMNVDKKSLKFVPRTNDQWRGKCSHLMTSSCVRSTPWKKLKWNFNPNSNIFTENNAFPLRWRHNGRDSVSNHQPHHCLLNRYMLKTSKLRVTGLCVGNSPVTGEFPAQMASNAEIVSIWWRHHGECCFRCAVPLSTVCVRVFVLEYFNIKHQSSASLAFVWGIHRWSVNSTHNWPVTRKMFPFDDVIMQHVVRNIATPFFSGPQCVIILNALR